MLFGHLLTNRAQIFSDVRTYWSPEAVKRVTGKELTGLAKNGIIHLINSGATTLDGTGQQTDAEGNPTMKPSWEITEAEVEKCLEATTWYPANRDYFRGGGFSSNFLSKGGMPVTMSRLNLIKGLGPVLQIAEGWTVEIDPEIHKLLDERTMIRFSALLHGMPLVWIRKVPITEHVKITDLSINNQFYAAGTGGFSVCSGFYLLLN